MFENLIGDERPLSWVLRFWPVLVVSFLAALVGTLISRKIAIRFGIVDMPDDLVKTHHKPVAYLGGIGIFTGISAGIIAGIVYLSGGEYFHQSSKWLLGILGGAAIACLIGFIDDLRDLRPSGKILGQVAAAVVLLAVGISPNLTFLTKQLYLPISPLIEDVLEIAIVIIFVVGSTNSLNLLDGLDGLCAGVTTVISLAMLLISIHLATWYFSGVGDPVRIIICLALVGASAGFLPFNRYPARIFMGDAGSMLLGFMIAALMILFGEHIPRWWMASVVVFGLPILDTAVALIRRLINHRPLFVSDRGHIYDQMIDRGIPLKKTVAISYYLAGLYALIGLAMSQIRTRYAGIVYVIVFGVSGIIVWKKGYLKMEGLRGAVRKQH